MLTATTMLNHTQEEAVEEAFSLGRICLKEVELYRLVYVNNWNSSIFTMSLMFIG